MMAVDYLADRIVGRNLFSWWWWCSLYLGPEIAKSYFHVIFPLCCIRNPHPFSNTCQITLTIPIPNTNTTQNPNTNTNTLPNTNTFYSVKRMSLSVPLPLLVDWGNIFPIELWLPMCFLPYKKYRFQVTSFWTHLLQEKYAHLCILFSSPYRALCGVLWPILQEI